MSFKLSDFKSRDWIFIIIILSLVQAFIWYLSFKYSNSPNDLGYWSFAGTIVSIILAVLAIGYTYAESQSEKNKANTIANQINELNSVIKTITLEASSLNKISEIKEDLVKLSTSFDTGILDTHRKVEEVQTTMQSIFSGYVKENSKPNTLNKIEVIQSLFSTRFPLLDVSLLIIYKIDGIKGNHMTILRDELKKYYDNAKLILEKENKKSILEFQGILYVVAYTISILRNFNLITIDKINGVNIDPDLKNLIKITITGPSNTGIDIITEMQKEILEEIGKKPI